MFKHEEYHIYTIDDRLVKRHVHLTKDQLDEAEELVNSRIDVDGDWKTRHKLKVADNIWLSVCNRKHNSPELISYGYEGEVHADDGDFEDKVFFDSMIFYKCVGTLGRDPDYSFSDIKEWVNEEHRDILEEQFDEYLRSRQFDSDEVIIDW